MCVRITVSPCLDYPSSGICYKIHADCNNVNSAHNVLYNNFNTIVDYCHTQKTRPLHKTQMTHFKSAHGWCPHAVFNHNT